MKCYRQQLDPHLPTKVRFVCVVVEFLLRQGSVINGFESISGQINAELVKPLTDKKFFLNTYGSLGGRLELNTHFNHKISEKWQTGVYIHGDYRGQKIDRNNDGFLDNPLTDQINVMNRWQYLDSEKGWVSFINLRLMDCLLYTSPSPRD